MARPTKLTPEVEERIIKALLAGSHIGIAARCAGVHADRPYRKFRGRAEQTLSEAEVRQLALIDRAGETHWRARAWLLERRHPDRWGRRAASDPDQAAARRGVAQSEARNPAIAVNALTDEQLDALAVAVGLRKPRQPTQDSRDEQHDNWLALAQEVWHELYKRAVPIGSELQRELVTAELEAIRQHDADSQHSSTLDDDRELRALRDKVAAHHGLPPPP